MLPGLTCATCTQPLYPHLARITPEGLVHAGRCPRLCDVPDCTEVHRARGYCRRHYDEHVLGRKPRPMPLTAEQVEDLEFMADTGEVWTRAASRVGLAPTTLENYLSDAGRWDLVRRLRAGETRVA